MLHIVQRFFSRYHNYDVCVYQVALILIVSYILKALQKRAKREAYKAMLTDIPLDLGSS